MKNYKTLKILFFCISFCVILCLIRFYHLPYIIKTDVVMKIQKTYYSIATDNSDTICYKAYIYKGFFRPIEILDKDSANKIYNNIEYHKNFKSTVYFVNKYDIPLKIIDNGF